MQISGLRPFETLKDDHESPPIKPESNQIYPKEVFMKPGGYKPTLDEYQILQDNIEWEGVKDMF